MDALLDDLDARQREAVTATAAPLAILAPAGSGKTRVLTRRIAWRVREEFAESRHVLAVTFTRPAAAELNGRVARLGVGPGITAGTFHALALAQLRRRAAEQGREAPTVLSSKARILGPLAGGAVADVAAEIEWAKARMLAPGAYAEAARSSARRPPRPASEIAEIYERYEQEKRKRRAFDFDDLLWQCADAIETDGAFAAGQRWRFRHLFVDEFQDATPLQVRLLRAWLGNRTELCVVGDIAQAIYAFAGADAAPLREFTTHFPGGTVVALDHNYRSTPQVVAVAESVLGPAAGVDATRVVQSMRLDGPAPTVTEYGDDGAEAAAIAQACFAAFARGVHWSEMAVLYRTNAQSSRFEAAFARRGVPVRMTGTARFADRPAVNAALEAMRAADRAAGRPRPFSEHLADLTAGPVEAPDAESQHEEELREHRDALLTLGREYLAVETGSTTLGGFVAWLDAGTRTDPTPEPGVDLVTFHRAKGLEWRVVFVTGCEQGLVPIGWAQTEAAIAEERRLLHVALSRAADEVHCSWARERTVASRTVRREPSPWLPMIAERAARVAPALLNTRTALAGMRAALDAATPPQPRRASRPR
jgi:DNA helicase-2/ATP-dependent DNA helicase PcrA